MPHHLHEDSIRNYGSIGSDMATAVTSGALSNSITVTAIALNNTMLSEACITSITIDTLAPTPAPLALPSSVPTPQPSPTRSAQPSPLPSPVPTYPSSDDDANNTGSSDADATDDDCITFAVFTGFIGFLVGICCACCANEVNLRLTKRASGKKTAYVSSKIVCDGELDDVVHFGESKCDAFTQMTIDARDTVTQTAFDTDDASRVSETSETLWAEASALERQWGDKKSEDPLFAHIVTEPGSVRYLKVRSRSHLVEWATFPFPSFSASCRASFRRSVVARGVVCTRDTAQQHGHGSIYRRRRHVAAVRIDLAAGPLLE